MANGAFNIAKGRIAHYGTLPQTNDAFILVLFKVIQADDTLNNYDDLAAIKAAVNFEGSPVQQFLLSAGIDMGIPAATKTPPPPAKEAADAAALDEMGL